VSGRGGGPVGFVGLGSMGSVLAGNLAAYGFDVMAYDAAGAGRLPDGATWGGSVSEVVRHVPGGTVVLSLPDGTASTSVARELAASTAVAVGLVVDTTTAGVGAARESARILAGRGIDHVDAPVSGGIEGARARTLTVMYAGADHACEAAQPTLQGLSERRRRVGNLPGQGQALKLANNFLSATALAATSEAVAFGTAAGLDMGVMLEVLDASSGASNATADKFPRQVLTGRYAAGFRAALMAKDVGLYRAEVAGSGGPDRLAELVSRMWEDFAAEQPDADFTRIYPFVSGS
jgi:3-hydroxyisobutyrate dehydrogenase-like beta-hydroxyacid dehydrogenase